LAKTCGALLEERQHPPVDPGIQLILTDRLRLDVTMTSRGEIYSWVGASKFEDSGIGAVVHQGPFSTGSFGAMVTIVLAQDPKTFQYRGTTQQDGRALMEYSFLEAQADSRYKVKTRDSWVNSGYSGSVQVDPLTYEVVRLTVQTGELPPAAGTCQISSNMEFHLVRIGDSAFPLPKQGLQRFLDINGDQVENTTTLAGCREYRGESTITFFPAPDTAGGSSPGSATPPPAGVPAGLHFTFELTTPISADIAAGGDPFSGRLASALRVKGKTIAPAHALVEGRLLRVEMRRVAPPSATFVLKLRTVEVAGVKIPLAAVRDFRRLSLPARRGAQLLLPNPWEQDSGVFQARGEHAAMKAGTRSDWVSK
ncbi:MAG: hypothetical protein P4L56_12705, partial [Candidatus Sulfopaludibacter sp.]|nr:hypothetical protein [Candidatus Sulfopaludibacter sp.]